MPTVKIPPVLRAQTGGEAELETRGLHGRRGPALARGGASRHDRAALRRRRRPEPLRQRLPQRRGRASAGRTRHRRCGLGHRRDPAGDGRRRRFPLVLPRPGRSVVEHQAEEAPGPLLERVVEHCADEPCSTMNPPSMKTTRSPTSRAKPISWVTTIIVIPSAASSRITSSTSLTSSGSSGARRPRRRASPAGPSPARGRSRLAAAGRRRAVPGTA